MVGGIAVVMGWLGTGGAQMLREDARTRATLAVTIMLTLLARGQAFDPPTYGPGFHEAWFSEDNLVVRFGIPLLIAYQLRGDLRIPDGMPLAIRAPLLAIITRYVLRRNLPVYFA